MLGLKIHICHCGEVKRKYRVFSVTREAASALTFIMTRETGESEQVSVEGYFLKKYQQKLV